MFFIKISAVLLFLQPILSVFPYKGYGTVPSQPAEAKKESNFDTTRSSNSDDEDNQVESFGDFVWKEIQSSKAGNSSLLVLFPDLNAIHQVLSGRGDALARDSMCSGCRLLLGSLVHQIKNRNMDPNSTFSFSMFLCKRIGFTTPDVCSGILDRAVPSLHWIIKSIPRMKPSLLCGILFQSLGCRVPQKVLSASPFEWTLEEIMKSSTNKSAVPRPKISVEDSKNYKQLARESSKNPNIMKIVHITDIHVDYDYRPGTNAQCPNGILCCREQDGNAISPKGAAGEFGDNRNCDAPEVTLIMALEHIKRKHGNNIDLIYMTGDLVPHNIWTSSREHNSAVVKRASNLIHKYFPETTVIPCLGNHDIHPINSFSPTSLAFGSAELNPIPQHLRSDWAYEVAYESWKQWIPADQAETFLHSGNYAVEIDPSFRVLVINTNICYGFNLWQLYDPQDPGSQLEWLSKQLELTKQQNRTAHIVSHIPPGHEDCLKTWSREFYKLVIQYKDTIRGQFYGHTHYDEFRLLHDPINKTVPQNLMWVGPSLTPYQMENPGYRIYHMNVGDNFAYGDILDHETWVYDLVKANTAYVSNNSIGPLDVPWFKLYQATEAYNIPNLLPSNMKSLIQRMTKDKKLFSLFFKHYFRTIDKVQRNHQSSCDTLCRKRILCEAVQPYYDDDDGQVECAMVQKQVDGIVLPLRVLEHRKRFNWL